MTFTAEQLNDARKGGYSDDEIWSYLGEQDQGFSGAKEAGYSLDEVAGYFGGLPKPETDSSVGQKLQTATEELEAGIGRAGGAFAQAAVGSVKMISDAFGANNPVSKKISGVEDYLDQFVTAQAKQDKQEISRLFQEAEDKGLGAKVLAGLQAVAVSPETLGPELAGYMLPSLAAGVLTGGASIPVQIGAQAALGGIQAAGSIKGNIYTSVRDYAREQGLDEDKADKLATEAQAYGGKNLDQILIGAGIGAAAASTGAERIITKLLTKGGKEVTKKSIGEFIKNGFKAGGVEAITEGTQEAQEQIASNLALQREGADVPTFRNVPQVATMGAAAGGLMGGAVGGIEILSAEQREERDINRDADKEARNLLVPEADSATQATVNDLNQRENAVQSLQEELDTLEPTDPKAQQLRLRISEEQKKTSDLKSQLSLPITTAEQQQIELAKQIAAPAKKEAKLPAMPSIAEQEAGLVYGAATGVFDVFAGVRRKPVVTKEPPVSMAGKQVIPGVTPVPVVAKQPKATKEAITTATNVANQIEEENKALEKLTKFNPPSAPTLQDTRSLPDAVAEKGKTLSISGGRQERNILDPKESKKRFDDIGYERQALELPEDMNDRVSGRYGSAIANIKSLYSTQWLGAHFHGGIAVNPEVKGTQKGRIVAHELGHASHSLLGDRINKDQNVLNELQAIEELLYPGLRAKVSAASNPDARFFNYLLSPNELIAEFNVERVSNPERAAQVAPTLSALLESAEKMKGLVADRKTFPTFIFTISESKERLKVKDLEPRKIKERIGDTLTSKHRQLSDQSKRILKWGKEGRLKNLKLAKLALSHLRKLYKAPKSFAKRTAELTGNQELIDYVEELYPEEAPTTEAPAITPAPVAETPAVAPAPEAAPIQRDVTRLEQMTPDEWNATQLAPLKKPSKQAMSKAVKYISDAIGRAQASWDLDRRTGTVNPKLPYPISTSLRIIRQNAQISGKENKLYNKEVDLASALSEIQNAGDMAFEFVGGDPIAFFATKTGSDIEVIRAYFNQKDEYTQDTEKQRQAIDRAFQDATPVSAAAVEAYGITLPEGYTKQGDLYVYQPTPAVSETITPAAEVAPAPAITGQLWSGTLFKGTRKKDARTDAGDFGSNADYWTGDASRAEAYSRPPIGTTGATGSVIESQVTLENPLVFQTTSEARAYRRSIVGDSLVDNPQSLEAAAKIENDLRSKGYDGVIVYDSEGNFTSTPNSPFEVVKLLPKGKATPTTPAVSETITPAEPEGKAEAIKFADEALRERDKEVGRYKKKADSERKAGREEMAQRYEGMIDDLMSVPANEFKQDVIENPAYYIESNVDPFLRFKNKEVNRAAPLTPSKRKKEAGGVLIPSREDLIQAGRNIYEAGMEFGAWAKQMIQRFGDAVRQFLADVWEAVSGFPAKLEEMAGHLPGKGERGAVTFGRGEEPPKKPAEPTPVTQAEPAPKKPAEEKPAMERYKGKAQVAGVRGIGAEKDTPKGINKKTEEIIKDRVFDATIVNDNQTKKAWNLIQKIEEKNPESGKNAQAINELTRETMQDVEADEVVKQSIGAVKLRNELYSYAIKLAGEGDPKMLNYLLNTRLSIGSGNIVEGDAGRLLQAMASLKSWIVRATEAEQKGFFDIAAQQFFGTKTPTDEQVQQIKNIFNKVKEVKIDQEKELMDELEEVGKAAGVDLPTAVDKQLENTPGLDPMVVAMTAMQKLYGGTITTQYEPISKRAQARFEGVKKIIQGGISNYRQKIVSKAANGLETGFWKTLSSTEQKPGPLGELDSAQNRALGNIVKQALIKMGLEGTPPDTKMSIYEQVASILGEQPLSQDKINMADEKIRGGIESKRQAELENAAEDQVDAINLKYDGMTFAWDDAMSRSLDMPVSDTMLRRMILNELKEADTSIQDIAKLMEEEPVIGASRQDRLVNSIIEKVTGITFEGQLTRDYTNLKTYLSNLLENMVLARQQKNKSAKAVAKVRKEASGDPNKQAEKQIEKLAKVQADPTIWGTGEAKVKLIDKVKQVVADALSLQLNIGFTPEQSAKIKNNWKGAFVADPNKKGIPTSFMLDMQRLGVDEATANTLADMVWNQIEFNAMNRQMGLINIAVEAGPIGGIVQAILDTPLANQQDPEWRKNVILDYLKNAGVKPSQAENIAKLFDVSLRKRFAKAQEEAAIKAAKSIKGGLTANSKRALEKFLKAIRAQVLDPGKDVAKAFAEEMGWKGFTSEQIVRLNELDAIVNDDEKTDAEKAVAIEQIQKIIDKVSNPTQIKEVLASFYIGNALMRFTTFAVQAFDPLAMTTFNTAIESFRNVTNPQQFIQTWADYGRALSNLFRETAFSYKNDVLRSGRMIDYLENEDRKIKRLADESVRKFKAGDIRGAMKDGIFGYTAWTFRTLKALDDGAYSLLTSTTLPQYVEAALKNAKIPSAKRNGVMRQILKARKLDIDQMVEQGIAKNDAVIYANERMQAAITKELSGLNIDAQEVINSAINDALSRIGKTRFVEDILTGKIEEIKDTGFLSSPFISFYEWAAKAANATEKESQKILYRIMFGFPLIAGRVFNAAAGYTPITLYRHFLNKDRYQLTYGTALQRRQRFIEQMAGTMVLLPLFLLRSNSLDDEEKKKRGFSIYVTGQGPSKLKDKTLHAKWNDAHKPFSMEFDFGKKGKFSIDAKSSGPFSVMIYTLGALDDWEINRKLNDLKTSKNDWREAEAKASIFSTLYEIGGYMLITTARRGPTTGLMQGLVDWRRYPDDPIAAIGAEISFSALPAVPILGTGVLKNLSDFFSQPIDNTTKEGAILANIPIVGPIAGKPALNAYGQKIGELRFSEKLKKSFGVPFTLVVRDSDEDNKLTSITLKNGKGPTPIRREDVENELKSSISDEEWYLAAKTFGDRNKKYVLENYDRYQRMSPTVFGDTISKLASESKKSAIQAVKNQRENNP